MRLKGNIITGIFQYVKGVVYTAGDMLVYNSDIYIILSDYDGTVNPSEADQCEPYLINKSYSSTGNESGVVTANCFKEILNSYFKGLVGNGELETIAITTPEDLDNYLSTGAYFCTLGEDAIPTVPTGDYLLRVYKSANKTIQEFLDYITGYIYYRVIDINGDESYSIVLNDGDEGYNKLISNFNSLSTRYKSLVNNLINLRSNAFTFSKLEVPEAVTDSNNNIYQLELLDTNSDSKLKDLILHMIISSDPSKSNGTDILQFTNEVYLMTNGIVTQTIEGQSLVRISYQNLNITITIPNSYKLETAYISKAK